MNSTTLLIASILLIGAIELSFAQYPGEVCEWECRVIYCNYYGECEYDCYEVCYPEYKNQKNRHKVNLHPVKGQVTHNPLKTVTSDDTYRRTNFGKVIKTKSVSPTVRVPNFSARVGSSPGGYISSNMRPR